MKPTLLTLLLLSLTATAPAALTSTAAATLPEIIVTAPEAGGLLPATGEYHNPGWTKKRRFATTRVFVQRDPGEVGLEQWYRVRTFDHQTSTNLFIEEIEIGLPHRVQLDFYYDWVNEHRKFAFKDLALEARWALADWGVLPLNPTLYAEYKWTDHDYGPDVVELKLLLGDDLGHGWQYGLNFVYEQETSGEKTTELQAAGGLSYTINDALSIGLETKYIHETIAGERSHPEHKFLIGPSAQIRCSAHTHLDFVSLFGVTKDAANVEGWVVFGIDLDFGKAANDHKIHAPVSGLRN